MSKEASAGSLLVVGTPIGNLEDMSPRGRKALAEADIVACEDSRRTGRLLQLLGLPKQKLLVLDAHRERQRTHQVMGEIADGKTVVLVSDAGMPLVSDPGSHLVRSALDQGLAVDVVPGPTAVISALVASGFPADRFVFEGFIPRRGLARRARLGSMAADDRTSVFYESPKRLAATLKDLIEVCGPDREAAVGRELTKLHESMRRGSLTELLEVTTGDDKGEVVIVLGPQLSSAAKVWTDEDLIDALDVEQAGGMSKRDAVAAVVAATGVGKRRVYDLSVADRSAGEEGR